MKLSEFAKLRNVHRDTITQYIRRNPELFEGHTKVDGKWLILDEEAERLLDEKYPLPKPVEIIEDKESREKLIKAQELIIQLQDKLGQAQGKIAKAEAMQLMLEDKERQLEWAEGQIEKLGSEAADLRSENSRSAEEIRRLTLENTESFKTVQELKAKNTEIIEENEEITKEIEPLKNRGLIARILNN